MATHDTDRRKAAYLKTLRLGAGRKAAALVAGIDRSTAYKWEDKDPKFKDDVDAALADGITRNLGRIEAAAEAGDWRAADRMLKYASPETFADRAEVTGPEGGPVAIDVRASLIDAARSLTDADLGLTDEPADERAANEE